MNKTHGALCRKYAGIARARKTRFQSRYPDYCTACGADGFTYSKDYWGELKQYPCTSCLEQGKCPRCGKQEIVQEPWKEFAGSYPVCAACNWTSLHEDDDANTLPFPPECYCEVLA